MPTTNRTSKIAESSTPPLPAQWTSTLQTPKARTNVQQIPLHPHHQTHPMPPQGRASSAATTTADATSPPQYGARTSLPRLFPHPTVPARHFPASTSTAPSSGIKISSSNSPCAYPIPPSSPSTPSTRSSTTALTSTASRSCTTTRGTMPRTQATSSAGNGNQNTNGNQGGNGNNRNGNNGNANGNAATGNQNANQNANQNTNGNANGNTGNANGRGRVNGNNNGNRKRGMGARFLSKVLY